MIRLSFLGCFLLPLVVFGQIQKPPAGSQINWSHPLSTGLVTLVPLCEGSGTNFYDAATQKTYPALALAGTPTNAQPPTWFTPPVTADYPWAGPAISNNGATAKAIQSTITTQFIPTTSTGYSYAVLMEALDATTFGRIYDGTGAAVITLYLNINQAGKLGKVSTTWRNASNNAINPLAAFTVNKWILVLCTVKNGLGVMYVNGVEAARDTTVNLANSVAAQTGQLCYNTTGNGSTMCNANFSSWWVWNNRVLTAQEAAQMYADPWAMFRPTVTVNPASQTGTSGNTINFTAAAAGNPAPTAQWQVSATGTAGPFSNIDSVANPTAVTGTLTLSNITPAQNGSAYQAVFTNTAGSCTTTPATLSVLWPPSVTTNPTSQTGTYGATVNFTAAASANPASTVQWQVSTTGNAGPFSNITGNATATTGTLTLANITPSQSGYAYQAVFTNASGSSTSTAATLKVYSLPPVLTLPSNITVPATSKNGAVVTFNGIANDTMDGTLTPLYSAPSGSTFPIGTTTVTGSATNSGGLTTTGSFTITVQRTFASFQDQQGLTNPDPTADPNHTGVSQLAAYAFGVNPALPDRSQLPTVGLQNNYLQISYPRWKDAADLTYVVEVSGDLQTWNFGSTCTQQVSVTPIDATREQVVERDLIPVSNASRRFMRVRITEGVGVISIWGGARETIILKSDGTVWAWGANFYGELGNGTTDNGTTNLQNDSWIPIQVHGPGNVGYLNSITAIMGGEMHNVALKSDGTVWAWGNNAMGQLGDGTQNNASTPVQVSGLSSITSLGGRGYHTLAIKSDGTIWAWGLNQSGQLGNGTTNATTVPVQVIGLTGPNAVSSGFTYSLALMPDGTVWSWGTNTHGELGNGLPIGSSNHSYTPVQILGLTNVTAISCGWFHAMALKSDGTVWTWGDNSAGELGDGTTVSRNVPVQVSGLTNVVLVSGGDDHSLALKSDGTVWKWGRNDVGEMGNGTADGANIYTPHPVPAQVQVDSSGAAFNTVKLAAARDYHNIAVKTDGSVWMWGANDRGQCGINNTGNVWRPVQVIGLGPIHNGNQ